MSTSAADVDAEFDSMAERLLALSEVPPEGQKQAIWTLFTRTPREGSTSITIGLARSLARSGAAQPLVLGFDTGAGGAARRMGASVEPMPGPGLGDSEISKYVRRRDDHGPSVLTMPEAFCTERVGANGCTSALQELSHSYAPILVDAGSLQSPLALRWCRLASLRVLVVDAQCTTREELERLASQLKAFRQPVSAVVLNKRETYVPRFLYRGSY